MSHLAPHLLPDGSLVARVDLDAPPVSTGVARRLQSAFVSGAGPGLLHLATVELASELPPAWRWLRSFGQSYLAAATRLPDLAERWATLEVVPPDWAHLEREMLRAPPFSGGEYLRPGHLRMWWNEVEVAFRSEAAAGCSVDDWLAARGAVWSVVGRVCVHVAENRRDPDHPFAFLATFVSGVGMDGRPRHLPLAQALQQARNDRDWLDTLLGPVYRAAEKSPVLARLVASRAVFQPQRWTATEAHAFLQQVPALEAAGLVVRVPDWWATGRRPRAQVTVTVGPAQPQGLGRDALLRFDVRVCVDGEPLSPAEQAALLENAEGLALLRGQWVELDAEALARVLGHWNAAREATAMSGLSFIEGMRLLAGLPAAGLPGVVGTSAEAWTTVVADPALAQLLTRLRSPHEQVQSHAIPGLRATLRAYQEQGVAWLHTLTSLGLGALLADDMGLGKTLQVLALVLLRRAKSERRLPSLVVVPTSLLPNWQTEAARFAPSLRVVVAHPSAGREAAESTGGRPWQCADLVLTSYGLLHRDERLHQTAWDLLVLDEAQAIKNPSATRSRAVRKLSSRARVLLTGTPVENRVGDLWALFDVANPGLLGTASQFNAACRAMGEDFSPLRRLVGPYILRRLKTDPAVAPDLPDKAETTVWCSLERNQAALYQDTVDRLARTLQQLNAGAVRRGAVLAALTRLKQLCDHPGLVLAPGSADAFPVGESGKLKALEQLARELSLRQDRVLVFTQYRRMMDPISDTLTRAFGRSGLQLHGGTLVPERADRVARFQQPDGPPFFVLSLRAAGTGLNLTAANHVVHFDRWWNPAVEDQATDRAHRIGQQQTVLVHRFVCRGTVEERIARLIEDKAALVHDIIGDDAAGPNITALDDAELLKLVSLDLHSALAT